MEFNCAIGESEENLKQLIASVKTLIRKILKVLSTEEHVWLPVFLFTAMGGVIDILFVFL